PRPAVLGPALPPGFHRPDDFPRPALPPGYTAEPSSSDEEEEDEEVIGPMPAQGAIRDSVALDIERRAQKMKDRLTGADVRTSPPLILRPDSRSTFLFYIQTLVLHPDSCSMSRLLFYIQTLILRSYSTEETEPVPQLSHRELQMAEKVSKYNETKRGESLISLHEKQLKRRKLDEGTKPVERRAFDRDQDLQVNKFDEAQKQRLLKKSQELNTRFGHSKEKMFL
uniref:GPALPP motifs-containing protein 1 n=1 Tax=Salmo trutta TaxID=8032 RepID=A0A674DJ94_SALTR